MYNNKCRGMLNIGLGVASSGEYIYCYMFFIRTMTIRNIRLKLGRDQEKFKNTGSLSFK